MPFSGSTESSMYSSTASHSVALKPRTVKMQSQQASCPPQYGQRSFRQKPSCNWPHATPQSGQRRCFCMDHLHCAEHYADTGKALKLDEPLIACPPATAAYRAGPGGRAAASCKRGSGRKPAAQPSNLTMLAVASKAMLASHRYPGKVSGSSTRWYPRSSASQLEATAHRYLPRARGPPRTRRRDSPATRRTPQVRQTLAAPTQRTGGETQKNRYGPRPGLCAPGPR